MTGAAGPKARMLQLDILRGVAIFLVFGAHHPLRAENAGLLDPVSKIWQRCGWAGVDLFFVLSGFLIGGLLMREFQTSAKLDVKRFIIRRGFKIWPSYIVYMLFVYVVVALEERAFAGGLHLDRAWRALIHIAPNCLHVQNYLWTPRNHTWSLAVEEHFYLVLPFVLQWLTARRRGTSIFSIHALPAVAGFVIIACTIGRHLSSVYLGYDWWHLTQPTHLRIDGLFLGVCIAYAHNFHRAWLAALGKHAPLLLAVGATLILPVFIWDRADQPWLCTFGFTSLYLGCGCVLVALLPVRPGSGALGRLCSSVVGRALAFVGFYSYAIYLWHRDLGENLTAWLLGHGFLAGYDGAARWLMGTTVYLALAIASGVVAGRLVELPALAVRERLFPPKASALAEQTDPAAESARPAEVPPG